MANIKQIDKTPGGARFVIHNNVAYFTEHVCRDASAVGIEAQTRSILERFDGIFAEHNLKKENILIMYGYLSDIRKAEQYKKAWIEWCGDTVHPSGIITGVNLEGSFEVGIGLTVAVD